MSRNEQPQMPPSAMKAEMSYRTLIRLYKVFGRYYKKHWKLAAVAYSGLLLTILIALFSPWPLKLILDHVVLGNPLPEKAAFLTRWFGEQHMEPVLAGLVLAFILFQVLDSVFSYLHQVGRV